MFKENYNVIGVMSGTSLDGIDLAELSFQLSDSHWQFQIGTCQTVAYSGDWLEKLRNAVSFSNEELTTLNREYTQLLANTIKGFIDQNHLSGIDAVCSHGHTVLHQPKAGITLQIGNLKQIATLTQQTVVCDFRVADVQLGGQGAPLVPIGDRLLFADYDYCLNLGGFSNISFEKDHSRLAFDISPVNTVLNFYANRLGFEYDDRGKLALSGQLNAELLHDLNQLDFYAKPYPKSLGFEYVKQTVLPLLQQFSIPDVDKLRTFTEHIAMQIASALPHPRGKMLVSGGGAYNSFLLERMQFYMPGLELIVPSQKILEYKEALIFGLLGVLRLRQEPNVLSSVTGARHDHSSGVIFTP